MGDMIDIFNALNEENAKYRRNNYNKRIQYAIKKFKDNGIKYKLCNENNGHFNLYYNNKVILSFWCWTGKIYSPLKPTEMRGIDNCIKIYKILERKSK